MSSKKDSPAVQTCPTCGEVCNRQLEDELNALRRQAAIPHSSLSVYRATLERAHRMIEERMHAHMHAHGCYDASTNAWEYQGGKATWNMAWEEGMQEALDIVDALLKNG